MSSTSAFMQHLYSWITKQGRPWQTRWKCEVKSHLDYRYIDTCSHRVSLWRNKRTTAKSRNGILRYGCRCVQRIVPPPSLRSIRAHSVPLISAAGRYHEDGGDTFLLNVCNHVQTRKASQPRRPKAAGTIVAWCCHLQVMTQEIQTKFSCKQTTRRIDAWVQILGDGTKQLHNSAIQTWVWRYLYKNNQMCVYEELNNFEQASSAIPYTRTTLQLTVI